MPKHSKKRRRHRDSSSDSSEDDKILKRKYKKLLKRLKYLERDSPERPEEDNHAASRHSLSPSNSLSRSGHSEPETNIEDDGIRDVNFADVEAELPVQANRETAPEEVPELDRNILSIIGDDIPQTKLMGPPLQKDIAMRWTTILKNGLKEGEKENLVTKYPPVENCPLIEAPKLNLEVVSALSDTVVKRDSRLEGLQTQVGAALSALSQALTDLLREVDDRPLALIEKISDASRLLLDLHHQKTVSRREIVSLNLKKELKETLTNVQVDGWLFGDNLGERVKASKEIERSAQELKGQSKFKPKRLIVRTQSNTLNYRRPPQQGYTRGQQGGRKQYHLTPNKRQPAKVLEKKKQQRRESSRGYQSKQHHRYQ